MKANRVLTIERMVKLGGVSRSGFYRFDPNAGPGPDPHMDLRDAIQKIALECPATVVRGSPPSSAARTGP